MTLVEQLADFVVRASYDELSEQARGQLKLRVLDALGCAFGAVEGEPVRMVRAAVEALGGQPRCTLVGGGRTAPDRAALYNAALVRYLDFNDSYLAKGETCHPSDNLAPVLAAAEYAGRGGREVLAALAVAYQVQCRLSDVAPVRNKGFDHTTQGSYAAAAGVSRALGLDAAQTANAIAISGTALNALRVTRTGLLSHWKGLAYPHTASGAVLAAFLARQGVTGPPQVFEGNKGFMESIAGRFHIDWAHEDLERVTRTMVKKYNAETHAQSAIEAALDLKRAQRFTAEDIARIEIVTFNVAYHIIGGGEEGDKTVVRTKEQADHSMHYMVAVALLDDEIMPAQYRQERIERADVQTLLRKVQVRLSPEFSEEFPGWMPTLVTIHLRDGRTLAKEMRDFEGYPTHPMSWETAADKFRRLSAPYVTAELQAEIVDAVAHLDALQTADLTRLLSAVRQTPA